MKMTNKLAMLVLMAGIGSNGAAVSARADEAPSVIKIIAQRFQFTPSEVDLKAGHPVTLQLTSMDVKHGFFSRPLKLDAVIPAGQMTEVTITPTAPGTYLVICDNFCGAGHGSMNMTVIVE